MEKKTNRQKSRTRKKNFPYRLVFLGLGILAFLSAGIGLGIHFLSDDQEISVDKSRIAAGVDYITSLEKKSTEAIEQTISRERKEAALAEIESEDFNVWAHFGNIVMMGDSRTKEFAASEFVEARRVLAEDGDSILHISSYLEDLSNLNPDYIILEYGVNDMENDVVWPNVAVYLQDMEQKINEIREAVPNAKIFVQSIFPCIEPELSRLACRAEIPAWNDAIESYCKENGIPFIDVTDLAETYQDYYEPDGMHFKASFYEFWAKKLLMEVVTYEA